MNNDISNFRNKCMENAFHCFGTAYIFEKRANKLRRYIRLLIFLGIAVPASIGLIVISFGVNLHYIHYFIITASVLGLVQLLLSIWSLVAKWDDSLAYSQEAISSNYNLSNDFRELAENPPNDDSERDLRYQILFTTNRMRNEKDIQQGINDKEKRMGYRASLRQFNRECPNCNIKPKSMKPSNCPICGTF